MSLPPISLTEGTRAPGDFVSHILAGKECWKPRQVQKEAKPEEAGSLNGKSGPLGPVVT